MKNITLLLIFGIMTLSLTHCEKDRGDKINTEINQRIFFQYEYINFAWGYQHAGWLVDSSGYVYCYNRPENWCFQDTLGLLSSIEMDSNILKTDSIYFKINKNILADKIGLINNATKGEISEPIHEMYDAGGTAYSGFTYDKNSKTYKNVLLKQFGDFRIDNSSSESIELYEWLDSINYKIHTIE